MSLGVLVGVKGVLVFKALGFVFKTLLERPKLEHSAQERSGSCSYLCVPCYPYQGEEVRAYRTRTAFQIMTAASTDQILNLIQCWKIRDTVHTYSHLVLLAEFEFTCSRAWPSPPFFAFAVRLSLKSSHQHYLSLTPDH